jgi:hypothetical protein
LLNENHFTRGGELSELRQLHHGVKIENEYVPREMGAGRARKSGSRRAVVRETRRAPEAGQQRFEG